MEVGKQYKWEAKRILVVEDDESSALLLKEILKGTGARIEYATLGDEAVEYMKKNPKTDLILMDIHLPDTDGFTATRAIKSFAGDVVVIAQTAYAFSADHRKAEKAGCDAYFTKPLVASVLLDKMNKFLS